MDNYYINRECGNIFRADAEGIRDMMAEAKELYDWGDPTNPATLDEYYEFVTVGE